MVQQLDIQQQMYTYLNLYLGTALQHAQPVLLGKCDHFHGSLFFGSENCWDSLELALERN
jgi:hypothetical protein